MIMYRGTPVPEQGAEPREYAAVFFSPSKAYAAFYGPWVQTYEVGRQNILRSESRKAIEVVSEFLDEEADKLAIEDLFFHPTKRLVTFLKGFGYTGAAVGENVGIFDLQKVRLIDQEEVVYFPGTGRFKVLK